MLGRFLVVLTVAIVLLGLLYYSQQRSEPLAVSGFVEADEIRLGSRVGGRVAEVHCEEGQTVTEGEPLVVLEEFDLDERRAEAEANLAAKKANYERLKNGFRKEEREQARAREERLQAVMAKLRAGPLEEEIKAAEARKDVAEAQLERARSAYDRVLSLFRDETGSVSRDEMEEATELLRVAEENVEVRTQELLLLKRGTREEDLAAAEAELEEAQYARALVDAGSRQEDIAQAEAAARAAQAALDVVTAQLGELVIMSPVPGVVEAVELQPGDLVSPSAPVLSIMDMSRLWVRAYVPEDRLKFKINDEVTVKVDSFPDTTFRGKITFISSQAEFTPNNVQTPEERSKQVFRIKVTLLDGLDRLWPGMPADVLLEP
jgi:multidrug resistance efflux pump